MFGSLFKPEQRVMANPWGEWPGDSGGITWAGANVSTSTSLQLLTVYGCNRFICEGIATLPVDTYRETNDRPVEIPPPRWLTQPTATLDRVAWLTQILTSLLLCGNAYLFREFDGEMGGPRYLIPLDPNKVSVTRVSGRKTFMVEGKPYTSSEVLHIPGVMFPGSDVGLSPVEAARQSIGAGMAQQEFGARFFGQGMTMAGVIENPGPLPPDRARDQAKAWARAHSGKTKAHLPGVLTEGATWKATSITNEQAQFLETRGFTAAEIAGQMFLIDPTELGIPIQQGGNLTYANLEQRNVRKVQVTFLPWIVRLEHAFSAEMLRPRYAKFNVAGLLRGDMKTRFEAYQVGISSKFMVPNEAREKEDMPPLPGGDVIADVPAPTGGQK